MTYRTPRLAGMPFMFPFCLPKGSTIEELKEGIPIAKTCYDDLTTENFYITPSESEDLTGGFVYFNQNYPRDTVLDHLKHINKTYGRELELGTTAEFFAFFKQQPQVIPPSSYGMTKTLGEKFLILDDSSGSMRFDLEQLDITIPMSYAVFVIEVPKAK